MKRSIISSPTVDSTGHPVSRPQSVESLHDRAVDGGDLCGEITEDRPRFRWLQRLCHPPLSLFALLAQPIGIGYLLN